MTKLFIFTISDSNKVPPDRGNLQVRSLSVIHSWSPEQRRMMKDPETITAMHRLLIAAKEGDRAPDWPVPYSPIVQAISVAWGYQNGMYGQRDGGPFAIELGDNIRALQGLEAVLERILPGDWHDARSLGRQLSELKRHLR